MPKYINPELILGKLGHYENDEAVVSVADLKQMIAQAELSGIEFTYCCRCKWANRSSDQYGNIEYKCPKRWNSLVDPGNFCGEGVDRYELQRET